LVQTQKKTRGWKKGQFPSQEKKGKHHTKDFGFENIDSDGNGEPAFPPKKKNDRQQKRSDCAINPDFARRNPIEGGGKKKTV